MPFRNTIRSMVHKNRRLWAGLDWDWKKTAQDFETQTGPRPVISPDGQSDPVCGLQTAPWQQGHDSILHCSGNFYREHTFITQMWPVT